MREGRRMARIHQEEAGAVAVVVAVFIAFVVLGLSALAIDGGSLWQSQRALVTDTDAMALAGARTLAEFEECSTGGSQKAAVETTVHELATRNGVDPSDVEPIELDCSGGARTVTVRANEASEGWFSGRDDLSAAGVTTAASRWLEFSGLAFCENFFVATNFPGFFTQDDLAAEDPIVEDAWLNMPYNANSNKLPAGVTSKLCEDNGGSGTLPGGWGWLDSTSFQELPPYVCGADLDGNWCDGDTGTNELNQWPVEPGDAFNFPVFDEAQGQGSNGEFRVVGIGQALLVGCSGSGSSETVIAQQWGEPHYGDCGGGPGGSGGQPNFITLNMFGYLPIADPSNVDDVNALVAPPPSICGVRANDGACVGLP